MSITMKNKKDDKGLQELKDRELIEEMEALEEIIDWLEEKDSLDIDEASHIIHVDEQEVDEWLKSPKLEKVRKWIDE